MRIFLALAGVIALACPAQADPPPTGWFGSFRAPAIVCNTLAEVRSIVDAGNANPDGGGNARYMELRFLRGPDGLPTCQIGPVLNVAVGESMDLGMFRVGADTSVHAWAVKIATAQGQWTLLYVEPLVRRLPSALGRDA